MLVAAASASRCLSAHRGCVILKIEGRREREPPSQPFVRLVKHGLHLCPDSPSSSTHRSSPAGALDFDHERVDHRGEELVLRGGTTLVLATAEATQKASKLRR